MPSAFEAAKQFHKVGTDLAKLPTKNVMAMARVTRAEIINSQPHGFKSLRKTPKDVAILKPRQRQFAAMTFVAGGFITTITEFGSYNSPNGWTIYPRAFTVAGGKAHAKVRYVGTARIMDVREKQARNSRVSMRDRDRVKHRALAFGSKGGKGAARFSHSAKHKAIPPQPFVRAAAERALNQSGFLYAEQVGKVMAGFR